MSESNTHRDALQRSLLASERLRIISILVLVTSLIFIYCLRVLIFSLPLNWIVMAALIGLISIELVAYRAVASACLENIAVPQGIWIGALIAEIAVPALCIAYLANPTVPPPYRPLTTPWVLLLFPIIALSVLRLKPSLSCLSGVMASSFYVAAAYHTGWRFALLDPSHLLDTQGAVVFNALILLGSGLVAGAVAAEIRKHAEGALTELSVREQLKQLQHDLDIARSIQQSLLPLAGPSLRGFEIAGWNRSADATGGDYFDWTKYPDGRCVITLADVTGHGIGPALLAAIARAYSRATFAREDTLVATLQAINRLLAKDLKPPHFVTLVAVQCNENDGTVQLLSAGHGPLFMYSLHDDKFRVLQSHSIPLGLMPEIVPAGPELLDLRPGDLVLLATDGFIEWENSEGEQFGADRFMQAVRRARNMGPDEIIAELYRSVAAFGNGTVQQDDVTAVIIKRTPVTADVPVGLGEQRGIEGDLVGSVVLR